MVATARGTVVLMPEVVIPVLNEAEALPWVLGRMPAGFDPIVVDNGSTDKSGTVAARLGARVVSEPQRGFGAACFAGLLAAETPIVCFMDGDGSLDPRELPLIATPLLQQRADLVLGARVATVQGAWPLHARLGNRILALELRRRSGLGLRDVGPMRALWRQPLLALGLRDRRYGWPLEMVLRAAQAGWRVCEVEVSYSPRMGGRSKVTGSVKGTLAAACDMTAALARADR
jgi:glycosyltransferase involved in cell wall biosynthesis